MVFDVKMECQFNRKARLFAGGHTTDPHLDTKYQIVVTRQSVRIELLIFMLNDLEISAANTSNAYLNAPCQDKVRTIAGSEFRSDKRCVMIIVRALYVLKTPGASCIYMLANTLYDLGYQSTCADPDAWIKLTTRPYGIGYYALVMILRTTSSQIPT